MYVRNDQIGVIAPLTLAGKTQTSVQVSFAGQTSAAIVKNVAPTAPGIFTVSATGTGQAAIVNQNGTINGPTSPAAKGSTIAIYLTGAGVTDAKQVIVAPVSVAIGGQNAAIAYAGAAPSSVTGLYQVNVAVPTTATSGNSPLVVTIGGVASQNSVTMSIQ